MSNDGCVPDPDFSRALTFEELNNVADVLILGTDDRKKIRNAAETLYQLQDTDLFRFFATELSTQSQLENCLRKICQMEKRRQNNLWNRLELIGINTCKYGIECEKQKTTSNAEVRSRIFWHKKEILQFVPHASIYLKKKSSELCGKKPLLKRR